MKISKRYILKLTIISIFLFCSTLPVHAEKELKLIVNQSLVNRPSLSKLDNDKFVLYEASKNGKVIELWDAKKLRLIKRLPNKLLFHSLIPSLDVPVESSNDYRLVKNHTNNYKLKYINEKASKIIKSSSPNGLYYPFVITNKDKLVAKTYTDTVKLWDLKSGKKLKVLLDSKSIVQDDKIISVNSNKTINIYSVISGKLLKTITGFKDKIDLVSLYKNKLSIGFVNGKIEVYNINTKKLLYKLNSSNGRIHSLINDSDMLVSNPERGYSKVWNLNNGKLAYTVQVRYDDNYYVPDENYIESGKLVSLMSKVNNPWIDVWDLKTGKLQKIITPEYKLNNVVINKNNIIYSSKNIIQVINLFTGKTIKTIKIHRNDINHLSVSNSKIISASGNVIKISDINTGKTIYELNGHKNSIEYLKSNDKNIASFSKDNTIKIWDINTGNLITSINSDYLASNEYYLQNNKNYINPKKVIYLTKNMVISSGEEEMYGIWDLNTGHLDNSIKDYDSRVNYLDYINDLIILWTNDNKISKLDPNVNKLSELDFPTDITDVSISDNNIFIASDKKVDQLDFNTYKIIKSFPNNFISKKVLSNKNTLVALDKNNKLIAWDIKSGKVIYKGFLQLDEAIGLNNNNLISSFYDKLKVMNLLNGEQSDISIDTRTYWIRDFSGEGDKIVFAYNKALPDNHNHNLFEVNILDKSSPKIIKNIILDDANHYFENNIQSIGYPNIINKSNIRIINNSLYFVYYGSVKAWNINSDKPILLNSYNITNKNNRFIEHVYNDKLITTEDSKTHKRSVISVLDIHNGKLIKSINLNNEIEEKLQIYDDELLIKIKDTTSVISLKNFNIIKVINSKVDIDLPETKTINNKKIIISNKTLKVEDLSTGKIISILHRQFDDKVYFEGISIWENHLIINEEDNSYSIFSLDTGKLIAKQYNLPDSGLIITPEGYYAGTGDYNKYVHFVEDDKLIELDSFKDSFNKPDLVKSALNGESLESYPKIDNLTFEN